MYGFHDYPFHAELFAGRDDENYSFTSNLLVFKFTEKCISKKLLRPIGKVGTLVDILLYTSKKYFQDVFFEISAEIVVLKIDKRVITKSTYLKGISKNKRFEN